MNIAGEHALGKERLVLLRSIGKVCPDARGGGLLADQIGQSRAVMGIGGARISSADQTVSPIDADMIFIDEQWDGQIDRFCRFGIGTCLDLGLCVFDRPARSQSFCRTLAGVHSLGMRLP